MILVLQRPHPPFSTIRIGNSRGVILSTQLIDKAGNSSDAEIVIRATKGVITIRESKKRQRVNTNLNTWDKQFKMAIEKGKKAEGDLWEGNLDPTVGSEIKKTRPAVIVSPASMNKYLQTVIVAPLTHIVKGYPSRVSGLFQSQPGDIALDQIRSVDKQRLLHRVGTVDVQTGGDIKKVLQTMFS